MKVGQPLDQECWSQINRRTLYRAHRWHNLYARGQDNTNYEFYLDFDSDLPSGLVVYIDTVEKTHVIDTRMMKVVQKSINSQPGNKRFISTSLRFNYSILYKDTEFRIRGGITSTSLRFAFNKDVYLVGVRHVMNGYGKQQDLRNGTINFRVRSANFKGEAWRNITGYMYQPFQVTVFDAAPSSRSSAVCNFETSYTECQMTLPESLKQEQLVHVPPHQFSDDGFQHTNLRCENGKYLWLHANGTYACEPCHAGYYCKDSVMRRCPFGHYSEDGASVCKTPYTNIDRFDSPSAANEKELTYDAPFYFQYNADGLQRASIPVMETCITTRIRRRVARALAQAIIAFLERTPSRVQLDSVASPALRTRAMEITIRTAIACLFAFLCHSKHVQSRVLMAQSWYQASPAPAMLAGGGQAWSTSHTGQSRNQMLGVANVPEGTSAR